MPKFVHALRSPVFVRLDIGLLPTKGKRFWSRQFSKTKGEYMWNLHWTAKTLKVEVQYSKICRLSNRRCIHDCSSGTTFTIFNIQTDKVESLVLSSIYPGQLLLMDETRMPWFQWSCPVS